MKGFVKVMIAGAVILGLGLIMFIAVLGLNGWHFKPDWKIENYQCAQNSETIKIDYSAGKVKIVYYDGDAVKVEYPVSEKFATTVTEENETLKLISGKRQWYNLIWFGWEIPDTIIMLPRDAQPACDITLNAGTVDLADGNYKNINMTINAGAVTFGNITCGNLNLTLNAGAFGSSGITADRITAEINAGAAELNNVVCGDVTAELNAGSLKAGISGDKEEYTVTVEAHAGSCNLSPATGTTDKRISVEINAGSCTVNFEN